jgi:hypothetical protein
VDFFHGSAVPLWLFHDHGQEGFDGHWNRFHGVGGDRFAIALGDRRKGALSFVFCSFVFASAMCEEPQGVAFSGKLPVVCIAIGGFQGLVPLSLLWRANIHYGQPAFPQPATLKSVLP